MSTTESEGERRFRFGANWKRFLRSLTPERLATAEESLRDALGVEDLEGMRFLDIGCGSGLFSLSAARLGATVHSFDYDRDSVECALDLRERFAPEAQWTIERGDALDRDYLGGLGSFDVVYSWGVLHHTGDLWSALDNATIPLEPEGLLFIALYHHMGWQTTAWRWVKKTYCRGRLGQALVLSTFVPGMVAYGALADALTRPFTNPLRRYRDYKDQERGMTVLWDWVDWLGGYPYQAATPAQVARFFQARGLGLYGCTLTDSSMGNNEFLFSADPEAHHQARERPWKGWRPSASEPIPPG